MYLFIHLLFHRCYGKGRYLPDSLSSSKHGGGEGEEEGGVEGRGTIGHLALIVKTSTRYL